MRKVFIGIVTLFLASEALYAQQHEGVVFAIKEVTLQSPVLQEIITDVLVKEGSEVKKGDVVVELRKEREELDVKLSEKLIQLKQFIARGHHKLFKDEMGSEEKALEAKTELELAVLQLEAKRIALAEKTVRAPLDGIVVKKYKDAGESVAREDKLVDIVNIDQVEVRFIRLPPALRPALKPGATVKVKVTELGNAEFSGKITFVDPRIDPASNTLQAWVEIENKDHQIKPGMRVQAEFGK